MLSLLTRHGFNEEESMFVEQQRSFESQTHPPPSRSHLVLQQSYVSISGVFGDHQSDWQQTEFASISMQANANTKFNWANQGRRTMRCAKLWPEIRLMDTEVRCEVACFADALT